MPLKRAEVARQRRPARPVPPVAPPSPPAASARPEPRKIVPQPRSAPPIVAPPPRRHCLASAAKAVVAKAPAGAVRRVRPSPWRRPWWPWWSSRRPPCCPLKASTPRRKSRRRQLSAVASPGNAYSLCKAAKAAEPAEIAAGCWLPKRPPPCSSNLYCPGEAADLARAAAPAHPPAHRGKGHTHTHRPPRRCLPGAWSCRKPGLGRFTPRPLWLTFRPRPTRNSRWWHSARQAHLRPQPALHRPWFVSPAHPRRPSRPGPGPAVRVPSTPRALALAVMPAQAQRAHPVLVPHWRASRLWTLLAPAAHHVPAALRQPARPRARSARPPVAAAAARSIPKPRKAR
jgi:hypothetical protein